jgi:hypothetical protein
MDNISLVTYAGQTVTPLDDALVYETAINQSGMIYGGIVTIKSANNLHISSGHGIVCGRKFTIFDSDIQVALSSSGTLLGRLYVQLDLSNVGTPIQLLVETGASLTPVQQDNNVNIMNGVFEFNIATFTVDTSTISNVIMVAPSAEPSTGAGSVITVTTSEASLAGKMCTITDGTTTLNANFDNTGKAVFYGVQMVGRVLVNATDGEYYASGEVNITYFGLYSTSIAFWGATINLSTTTPEFYGQNITVEQDGILVSTISFDGTGHATYIAPALGVYDFTVTYGGNEYTATVNVTEETTYSKSIDIAPAGLDLSAWITAGSTTGYPLNPSSYADFSALEADEAAVRQLMTVHASVDFLAQAEAGDSLMESVIGSDVCAKWINLSDYALDTLYANSDIADEMDSADKYGYGEWGVIDSTTTPPTWGALGNVPIMTANNAPYGTVSASSYYQKQETLSPFMAFNGFASNGWIPGASSTFPQYLQYDFVNPICPKMMKIENYHPSVATVINTRVEVWASNDGFTTHDVIGTYTVEKLATIYDTLLTATTFYKSLRLYLTGSDSGITTGAGWKLQFYGRELPVKQASAPTDGREYVHIGSDYYTEDWGEKDFATGSTRKTIYDHGVAPSGAITGGTKNPDCLTLSAVGTATVNIDKGTRTYMGGKAGLHASGTNRLKCGSGYSAFTASNMPDSNGFDISSISGSVAVGIEQTASGTFDCTEIWIE